MRGYTVNKDQYAKRLRRIEAQVRGLQRMIDEDVHCIDVLTPISEATKALQGIAVGLLDEHLRHCVQEAAADDPGRSEELISEATRAVERFVRS